MLDKWSDKTTFGCGTCQWFIVKETVNLGQAKNHARVVSRAAEPGIILGRCRRHAPTMNGYPVVHLTDWCGDHKLGLAPNQ